MTDSCAVAVKKTNSVIRNLLKNRSLLIGYLRNLTGDSALADELFQDLCVAVLEMAQAIKRGEREVPNDLLAWACGAARKMVAGKFENGKRLVFLSYPELEAVIETAYAEEPVEGPCYEETQAQLFRLRECFSKLSGWQREMIRLRYFTGLSLARMAERLSRSESAVQVALSRLRKVLGNCVRRVQAEERV
jgi:RNA polymerase sigma-70 factor (ECF subfamily)